MHTQGSAVLCAGGYEDEEDREGSNADLLDDLEEQEEEGGEADEQEWEGRSGKLAIIALLMMSMLLIGAPWLHMCVLILDNPRPAMQLIVAFRQQGLTSCLAGQGFTKSPCGHLEYQHSFAVQGVMKMKAMRIFCLAILKETTWRSRRKIRDNFGSPICQVTLWEVSMLEDSYSRTLTWEQQKLSSHLTCCMASVIYIAAACWYERLVQSTLHASKQRFRVCFWLAVSAYALWVLPLQRVVCWEQALGAPMVGLAMLLPSTSSPNTEQVVLSSEVSTISSSFRMSSSSMSCSRMSCKTGSSLHGPRHAALTHQHLILMGPSHVVPSHMMPGHRTPGYMAQRHPALTYMNLSPRGVRHSAPSPPAVSHVGPSHPATNHVVPSLPAASLLLERLPGQSQYQAARLLSSLPSQRLPEQLQHKAASLPAASLPSKRLPGQRQL